MKITSPDKQIFANGITKIDVVNYYREIANHMLPYLQGRILSLVRCPQGTCKTCFYKKNPDNDEEYYHISTVEELTEQTQLNTIEFHTWGSQMKNKDKPDIMVFDLDPGPNVTLDSIRQGATDIRTVLKQLGLESFLKTSGNSGYHIVVPFNATLNWEVFKAFAKNVAELLENTHPALYTTNIRKNTRADKIFVDWLRNTKGATFIAPYSLRIKNPAVSAPISWNELYKIAPNEVTMEMALQRVKKKNPWSDFFEVKSKQFLN